MTLVTAEGWIALLFIAAALTALILGVIFSHQLNRYGASSKTSSLAELLYTLVAVILLGVSAYALFFFYL